MSRIAVPDDAGWWPDLAVLADLAPYSRLAGFVEARAVSSSKSLAPSWLDALGNRLNAGIASLHETRLWAAGQVLEHWLGQRVLVGTYTPRGRGLVGLLEMEDQLTARGLLWWGVHELGVRGWPHLHCLVTVPEGGNRLKAAGWRVPVSDGWQWGFPDGGAELVRYLVKEPGLFQSGGRRIVGDARGLGTFWYALRALGGAFPEDLPVAPEWRYALDLNQSYDARYLRSWRALFRGLGIVPEERWRAPNAEEPVRAKPELTAIPLTWRTCR